MNFVNNYESKNNYFINYFSSNFDYMPGDRCTTMLATGNATKNNETFLMQNLDGGWFLTILLRTLSLSILINRTNSNNFKYAFIGIPGILEHPIINEKGLGLGQTATLCKKGRYRPDMDREGVYINSLIRTTMKTCRNVQEVVELWRNTKISYFFKNGQINQSTVWCDRDGGILSLEVGPGTIKAVFGDSTDITGSKKGIIWHSRHHQWLDGNETGSLLHGENLGSTLNAERAREMLEENYGKITLDVCKKLTADHGKQKFEGLCKHPDDERKVYTCYSYIIEPKNMRVHLSRDYPCKNKFRKYDFTNKF